MDLTLNERAELRGIIDNYKVIESFVAKNKRLSYMNLDYAVMHDLTLFTVEPDVSFEALEEKINAILKVLPSVKQIFAKPFIHLKEQDVILQTEAVRIINNKTLNHISSHTELWTDIKDNEVKPSKLLTKTYEDDYGIYENRVFCDLVDDVLAFARKEIRFLREMIYTNRTIEINLLERVNHLNYFLALGKLHTGYSRNFDSYYDIAARCLNKLQFISNSIIPRLKRPVYKNNRLRHARGKLRKTNILSMHRDYHQVYKLAKYFEADVSVLERGLTDSDVTKLQNDYFCFCEMLSLFAVGHFNFVCDKDETISFSRLNADFRFKDWKLKIKKSICNEIPFIAIYVEKDVKYKIVLIPSVFADSSELLSEVKSNEIADEYSICTPREEYAGDTILLDITNIESFRRIQQIVLRAMIYADVEKTECPFCNNKLAHTIGSDGKSVYECKSCRTEIAEEYCPVSDKKFFFTRIENYSPRISSEEEWLAKRKSEALMYFRNITKINDKTEIICPICGGIHK